MNDSTPHSMPHTRKLTRIARWSGCVAGILLGLTAGGAAYATRTWDAPVAAPRPPIHADRSPAAVARGAAIFHSTCEICHRDGGSTRASGAPDGDAPAFLGRLHAPNLTSDPLHGIGAVADEDIARMIRYGVKRSGHRGVMPTYGMGDADIAAVLGYLRSDDPLFSPDPSASPPSTVSTLGKVVLVASGMSAVPDRPAAGVPVPDRSDTAAYGRYLAHDVFDCVGCHTPGYSPSKGAGPDMLAGGFEFDRPGGATVVSSNLTPDEPTGIGRYSRDDLGRALRQGKRPDGRILSVPMPIFRALDDGDVNALYTYLRSLPPRRNDGVSRVAAAASKDDPATMMPEARFRQLGCVGCHGKGAPHAGALARARDKSAEELARWIRNPERFVPGTQMPTYAELLDEPGALELATWVKTGGPHELATR